MAVYHQSFFLGAKPLETHGQNCFSQLNTCSRSPYITSFLTRGGSVIYNCCWPSPVHSFSSRPYFTVRFETSLFVASYDWQGYGGGIRPRLHMGFWSTNCVKKSKSKLYYDRQSVGQSVLVSSTHLGPTTRFLLLSDSCMFVNMGRSLWRENGSAVYGCCWSSPAQSYLWPSPVGFVTIFYSLRFETPPTWRARSPYLYPPGTGCNCVTAFTSLISTLHRLHGKHSLYCWWHHHIRGSLLT
jgi:hypothetical protein